MNWALIEGGLEELSATLVYMNVEQSRPLLSAVVVRKDTKMPGEGFWGLTYEAQSAKTGGDRRNFWESELNKVYGYWQRHDL